MGKGGGWGVRGAGRGRRGSIEEEGEGGMRKRGGKMWEGGRER